MSAGNLGDRFGRRNSLQALAILHLALPLGCAFAWGWYPLVFFRCLGGLGIGRFSLLGLQFFVVLFIYPETEGLTLEVMEKKLGLA